MNYTAAVALQRRGENDSFSNQGLVRRYQIQVEGFHNIGGYGFSESNSVEAREVRRAIRNEFSSPCADEFKVRCDWMPHIENKQLLDHLVDDRLRRCSLGRRT